QQGQQSQQPAPQEDSLSQGKQGAPQRTQSQQAPTSQPHQQAKESLREVAAKRAVEVLQDTSKKATVAPLPTTSNLPQPAQHQPPAHSGEDEEGTIGDKELLTIMEGRLKRYRAVKQRLQHVESEKTGLEIENSDLRAKLLAEQRENDRLSKE